VHDAFNSFQREAPEVSIHLAPLNTPEQVAEILAAFSVCARRFISVDFPDAILPQTL
jgi:hypothetical protein